MAPGCSAFGLQRLLTASVSRTLDVEGSVAYSLDMTDAASGSHHAIDYVEITVPDLAAAKAFYSAAFGWAFNDYGPGYAGIRGETREQGGLTQGEPRGAGGPLVVVYSQDLDATLGAVESAGGTITTPPFDFPGGRRFHFADLGGNELAVWTETAVDSGR